MISEQCKGFIKTPPIWEGEQFGIQQFEFPPVDMDIFQAKSITGNYRLGHQMEFAFKQLIEFSTAYEIILYNLQISNSARTIGEIDFILHDHILDKLVHVELTYKFYIIDTSIQDPVHSLIGPNKRDLFFTKRGKIKNAQFSLLHTPEGAKALHAKNIDHLSVEHQCCFKAQLFKPYGENNLLLGPLNEACIIGSWLNFEEFNTTEFQKAHFYIPTKSEWVIRPHLEVEWHSHTAIVQDIQLLHKEEKAPMLWMKKSDLEIEKVFILWW